MATINELKYNGRSAIKTAERNGINRKVFANRIHHGWSIRRACTFKRQPNLKIIASELGIKYRRLCYLIAQKGWTCEELLEKQKKGE